MGRPSAVVTSDPPAFSRAAGLIHESPPWSDLKLNTVFGLKAGLAIGRAVASWILSLFGYVPNGTQSADSILGIKLLASVFAALAFFLGVACLFLYRIDTKTNIQMTAELAERRKEYSS